MSLLRSSINIITESFELVDIRFVPISSSIPWKFIAVASIVARTCEILSSDIGRAEFFHVPALADWFLFLFFFFNVPHSYQPTLE